MSTRCAVTNPPHGGDLSPDRKRGRVHRLLLTTVALALTACGGGGFRSTAPYAGDVEPTLARPTTALAERAPTPSPTPPRPTEPLVAQASPAAAGPTAPTQGLSDAPPARQATTPLPPPPTVAQAPARPASQPPPSAAPEPFTFGSTAPSQPPPPSVPLPGRTPTPPALGASPLPNLTQVAQTPAAGVPQRYPVPILALAPPPPEPASVPALGTGQTGGALLAEAGPATTVDPRQFLAPRPALSTEYPNLGSVPPTPPLPQARETARIQAQLERDRADLQAGRIPTAPRPAPQVAQAAPPVVTPQPQPVPAVQPLTSAQATSTTGGLGQLTGLEAADLEPSGIEPPRGPFLVDRPAQLPVPSSARAQTIAAQTTASPTVQPAVSTPSLTSGAPPGLAAAPTAVSAPAGPFLQTATSTTATSTPASAPPASATAPQAPAFATTPTSAGRVAPPETRPAPRPQQVASVPSTAVSTAPDPVRAAMQQRFSQSGATAVTQTAAIPRAAPQAVARTAGFQVAVLYFGPGESGISDQNADVLRQVARVQRDRSAPLRIIGHALLPVSDSGAGVEAQRRNFETSLRRANSVAEALGRLGVPTGAIQVSALGDTQPAGTQATSRRVQVLMDL